MSTFSEKIGTHINSLESPRQAGTVGQMSREQGMSTYRLVLQHKIPLEQTASGEVETRTVSFVVYAQLVRARPGSENVFVGNTIVASPVIYKARLDSLPPDLTTDWTLLNEEGQEHDIVSIQPVPRPPRSRMREIKCQRRT